MAAKPLPNYLRMYRKRLHMTQDELAFIIGGRDGAKPSRYERFRRMPKLETALALEAALGVPVSELFRGEYAKVEAKVKRRRKVLSYRMRHEGRGGRT
jgi:transcriptional regulator with XRE-family HTH domain